MLRTQKVGCATVRGCMAINGEGGSKLKLHFVRHFCITLSFLVFQSVCLSKACEDRSGYAYQDDV